MRAAWHIFLPQCGKINDINGGYMYLSVCGKKYSYMYMCRYSLPDTTRHTIYYDNLMLINMTDWYTLPISF